MKRIIPQGHICYCVYTLVSETTEHVLFYVLMVVEWDSSVCEEDVAQGTFEFSYLGISTHHVKQKRLP